MNRPFEIGSRCMVVSAVFGSIHRVGQVVTVERAFCDEGAWCIYVRGDNGPGWLPADALERVAS